MNGIYLYFVNKLLSSWPLLGLYDPNFDTSKYTFLFFKYLSDSVDKRSDGMFCVV